MHNTVCYHLIRQSMTAYRVLLNKFTNKYMYQNLSCVSYMTVFLYMVQSRKENCVNAGELLFSVL